MARNNDHAISIAMLGPEDSPARALFRMRRTLEADHASVSALDEVGVWAAMDVGDDKRIGSPVDPARLVKWVRRVSELIIGEPRVGSVISLGQGAIGDGRLTGSAMDEAERLTGSIVAGDVRVTGEVAKIIDQHRDPEHRLRTRAVGGGGSLRTVLDPRIRDAVPVEGAGLTGIVSGAQEALKGIRFHHSPLRAFRSSSGLDPVYLEPGDRLEVRYSAPRGCWLYLLLEQDDRLELVNGGNPIGSPDHDAEGTLELAPSPTVKYVCPHLVVLHDEGTDLDPLLRSARTAGGAKETLARLSELLVEYGQPLFGIVEAGRYFAAGV